MSIDYYNLGHTGNWIKQQLERTEALTYTAHCVTPDMVKQSGDTDAQKINRAIRATQTPGNQFFGYSVYLPAGVYYIDDSINVIENTILFGSGNDTELIAKPRMENGAWVPLDMFRISAYTDISYFKVTLKNNRTYRGTEPDEPYYYAGLDPQTEQEIDFEHGPLLHVFEVDENTLEGINRYGIDTRVDIKVHDILVAGRTMSSEANAGLVFNPQSAIINCRLTKYIMADTTVANGVYGLIFDAVNTKIDPDFNIGYYAHLYVARDFTAAGQKFSYTDISGQVHTKTVTDSQMNYFWWTTTIFSNFEIFGTLYGIFTDEDNYHWNLHNKGVGAADMRLLNGNSQKAQQKRTGIYTGALLHTPSGNVVNCMPYDLSNINRPGYLSYKSNMFGQNNQNTINVAPYSNLIGKMGYVDDMTYNEDRSQDTYFGKEYVLSWGSSGYYNTYYMSRTPYSQMVLNKVLNGAGATAGLNLLLFSKIYKENSSTREGISFYSMLNSFWVHTLITYDVTTSSSNIYPTVYMDAMPGTPCRYSYRNVPVGTYSTYKVTSADVQAEKFVKQSSKYVFNYVYQTDNTIYNNFMSNHNDIDGTLKLKEFNEQDDGPGIYVMTAGDARTNGKLVNTYKYCTLELLKDVERNNNPSPEYHIIYETINNNSSDTINKFVGMVDGDKYYCNYNDKNIPVNQKILKYAWSVEAQSGDAVNRIMINHSKLGSSLSDDELILIYISDDTLALSLRNNIKYVLTKNKINNDTDSFVPYYLFDDGCEIYQTHTFTNDDIGKTYNIIFEQARKLQIYATSNSAIETSNIYANGTHSITGQDLIKDNVSVQAGYEIPSFPLQDSTYIGMKICLVFDDDNDDNFNLENASISTTNSEFSSSKDIYGLIDSSLAPDWQQNTYYTYANGVYNLQIAEPADWQDNYRIYYKKKKGIIFTFNNTASSAANIQILSPSTKFTDRDLNVSQHFHVYLLSNQNQKAAKVSIRPIIKYYYNGNLQSGQTYYYNNRSGSALPSNRLYENNDGSDYVLNGRFQIEYPSTTSANSIVLKSEIDAIEGYDILHWGNVTNLNYFKADNIDVTTESYSPEPRGVQGLLRTINSFSAQPYDVYVTYSSNAINDIRYNTQGAYVMKNDPRQMSIDASRLNLYQLRVDEDNLTVDAINATNIKNVGVGLLQDDYTSVKYPTKYFLSQNNVEMSRGQTSIIRVTFDPVMPDVTTLRLTLGDKSIASVAQKYVDIGILEVTITGLKTGTTTLTIQTAYTDNVAIPAICSITVT